LPPLKQSKAAAYKAGWRVSVLFADPAVAQQWPPEPAQSRKMIIADHARVFRRMNIGEHYMSDHPHARITG